MLLVPRSVRGNTRASRLFDSSPVSFIRVKVGGRRKNSIDATRQDIDCHARRLFDIHRGVRGGREKHTRASTLKFVMQSAHARVEFRTAFCRGISQNMRARERARHEQSRGSLKLVTRPIEKMSHRSNLNIPIFSPTRVAAACSSRRVICMRFRCTCGMVVRRSKD